MFKVVLNDGKTEMPKDDVYYVIGKKGIFLRKKMGLVDALVPVKQLSFLEDVHPFVRLNLPRIPKPILGQIIGFFRKVYEEYRSECVVLLFLDQHMNYSIYVPPQKVTGSSISYMRNASFPNKQLVCSIHSHAGFSAFHSGTDIDDEESFDGLHVTLGDIDEDPNVTIAVSAAANGERCAVDPKLYLDVSIIKDEEEKHETEGKYSHLSKYYFKKNTRYLIRTRPFPKEWMNFVEGTKYVYTPYTYSNEYEHRSHGFGYNWRQNPNSFYPWQTKKDKDTEKNAPIKIFKSPDSKTPIAVVPRDLKVGAHMPDKSEFDPCKECIFSSKKSVCHCDGDKKPIEDKIETYDDNIDQEAQARFCKIETKETDYNLSDEEILKFYGMG